MIEIVYNTIFAWIYIFFLGVEVSQVKLSLLKLRLGSSLSSTHHKLIELELTHKLLKLNEIARVRYKLSFFNLINYDI